MPGGPPNLQVEFFARVGEIDCALWEACFPAPLEGLFWYETLERSGLEDQFTFRYALIRVDGRPVGIAPCFVHDVPIALVAPKPVAFVLRSLSPIFPRAAFQRTFFIGSPCSDEGTIGLLPGFTLADVAPALISAVRREALAFRAPVVAFKDFRSSDAKILSGHDGFFSMVSYPGAAVTLPPGGMDAYLRGLSQNQRHQFRKKLRRSREILHLKVSIVPRPTDSELREIFGLFWQTYERGKTKFERLRPSFFEEIRGRDPVHFILLRDAASGELAAFMLVFHLGPRLINKFIGIDYYRGPHAYLYFRLFEAALDFAYSQGAAEIQSGQTGYRAKLDLGHRLVPLANILRHQNPLLHALYRAVCTRLTRKSLDSDLP